MLIVEALAQDHRKLEQLMDELADAPSTEPRARLEIFGRLQSLLQAHSRAEEEVVYRALRRKLPEDPEPLQAYEQHHVADLLLQELASSAPGRVRWSAKARVLDECVRQHIREEEITSFALLGQHFDDVAQAAMAHDFLAVKHETIEALLGPLRQAMPAFAGHALLPAQVFVGRLMRRGELYLRRGDGGAQRLRAAEHRRAAG